MLPPATAVATELDGKILVDCTNLVGPGLTHGLLSARSGAKAIQAAAPGALSSSLHLEPHTLLWIKMARANGAGSDLVWARLRR